MYYFISNSELFCTVVLEKTAFTRASLFSNIFVSYHSSFHTFAYICVGLGITCTVNVEARPIIINVGLNLP